MMSNIVSIIKSMVRNNDDNRVDLNDAAMVQRFQQFLEFEQQQHNTSQNSDVSMEEDTNEESEEEHGETYGTPVKFPTKPTYIYVRVSTNPQDVEAQRYACVKYATDNGLGITGVIVEKGSAYKSKQPKLVELICKNKNVNIIVHAIDRFSRNIERCDAMVKIMTRNDITLLCVKTLVDLDTAMGKHNFRQAVSMAQYESELIGERVKSSTKFRRAMGIHIGAAPYGYSVVDKHLVRNDEESHVIKFIIQNRAPRNSVDRVNKLLLTLMTNIGRKGDYAEMELSCEDDEKVYKVYEPDELFTMTYASIANVLNCFEITKKGKQWTGAMVNRLVKQQYEGVGIRRIQIE